MRHELPHGANNYGEVELALADLSDGGGAGVEDTLWKTRCGRRAVEDALWKTRRPRVPCQPTSTKPATVSAGVDELSA